MTHELVPSPVRLPVRAGPGQPEPSPALEDLYLPSAEKIGDRSDFELPNSLDEGFWVELVVCHQSRHNGLDCGLIDLRMLVDQEGE